MRKFALFAFSSFVFLSLLTPFWVFSHLQFPYVTSKAFYFRICMEVALPFYLYLIVAYKQYRPKLKNPLNIAVLAFLVISIASALTGVNVIRSLWGNFERMGGAYYLAHLVLLYFYIQALGQAGGSYLKRFLQAFIAVAVAVTINGLFGWLHWPTLTIDPSLPARVSSTFGNPIFFASYLIIPMFLAAYFAVSEESRALRVLYILACLLQLWGIYASGTRGAVVGLIAGVFVGAVAYVIATSNKKLRLYGLIVIAVFVVGGGTLFALHSKLPPGSTLYRLANLKDTNTEARIVQWGIALKGYKDHPILGVGSENYYVISNSYYNSIMYKYDPSWFDKPHNYWIEVLVTNGALGLLAYLSMFGFSMYALWRAYKAGLLGLLETCLLFMAMVSYQVQNLTVFDTVSASVAFYGFLGLAAYLWVESAASETVTEKVANGKKTLAHAVLVGGVLVVALVLYISNIQSLEAAKRTNFGYAYASYDPHIAANYFASALAVPYNLDPRETASRYSDFVNGLVNSDSLTKEPQFVSDQLDKATNAQKVITEKTKNDPLLYMRLATDEMDQAIVHNTDITEAQKTINTTIALAPKRVELLQLQIQLYGYLKDWKDVIPVAQQSVQLDPYNPSLNWQLATAYYLNGQVDDAVKAGDTAIANGFMFSSLQQFAWYIQYYETKKDYAKVAPLLEQAIALQPNEISLYADLAKVYGVLGNYERATLLARQVEQSDPSQKAAMEALIASFPKQ